MLFSLFSLLFVHIIRAEYYISTPASAWTVGNQVTVSWQINSGPFGKIIVDLMNGPDLNGIAILNIATGLSPTTTSVNWTVDATLPTGSRYFLRVTGTNSPPVINYSGRLAINGGPGTDDIYYASNNRPIQSGSANDVSACPSCKNVMHNYGSAISYSFTALAVTTVIALISF